MKNRIIEICELGQPKSIIHRENKPTSELIKTTDLVGELNKQLLLHNVVGQSEQLADHKCKPMVNADWTYLRCECGKRFEPKG